MKIHHLDSDHALASLHTRASGLTRAEAEARLREFGANRVATAARTSPWRALLRHLTHFFALLLWIAAALAGLAEVRDPGHGMATLAWAIIGVIVVNALFSWLQEARAQRALDALQRMLPHRVNVLRDGTAQTLDATELVPGDIVLLTGGDEVPADCRVLEAFGARVNTATVTGESRPQTRHAQPVTDERLIDARNVVLAGTTLLAGELRAVVFATGMHTEFGRIAHLTQTTAKDISPLQREIERLSRWIALFAVALGVLFFAIGTALGTPFWVNLVFAVGIIVANVPEGLLPTVTLALAMGAQRMARRNALIRRLPSVETLGSTTVICTDKTGTLTENRLRVAALYADGHDLDAAQLGANGSHALHLAADIAAHCHNLAAAANAHGDPLERALVEFARGMRPATSLQPRVDEIPFDSDRRRMTTVHRVDGGCVVYTKGALEVVLPRCTHVLDGNAPQPLDAPRRAALLAAEDGYAQRGLRVIALAWRELPDGAVGGDVEQDLTLVALAALHDPPRPEVPRAIQQCRDAGIRVVMVTGDHPRTAVAVARNIGLVNSASPRVITGSELERLSDTQLQLALDRPDVLFARIGADQKRRIVAALKRKAEVVAVTGDGVNDAPALKEAHIGIAMGRSGTDVAKECADVVLLDDNFATIVAAIEEGRAVFDNIRKFLTYILTSNIPEIVPYLAWGLFAIPLPLTVIQILAVDLGTDLLPALALGAERADPQTMTRPPRRRTQRLIDGALIARAYLFLGIFEAAAALTAFLYVLNTGGWSYGDPLPSNDPLYLEATTACLAAIVLMQIVNVWLCRSGTRALWQLPLFNNPLILLGIASELVLLAVIVYTPWGQAVFGTATLDVNVLLFVVPFAIGMWLAEELRKAWVRAHPK